MAYAQIAKFKALGIAIVSFCLLNSCSNQNSITGQLKRQNEANGARSNTKVENVEANSADGANKDSDSQGNSSFPSSFGQGFNQVTTQLPSKDSNGWFKGILDCPTVTLFNKFQTEVNSAENDETDVKFARTCAGCHGQSGEGKVGYPAIDSKSNLSEAAFVNAVRNGVGKNMPKFSNEELNSTALKEIYLRLRGMGGPRSTPSTSPQKTSAEALQQTRSVGLAAWRLPDAKGSACVNCHSPDALDLAVIGFDDGAILRRARQHLSAENSARIVDFVHAQRVHFKIASSCAPTWRPFQPGGEVLPGKTPEEQDFSFGNELKLRGLKIATGKVENLADAKVAAGEMVATNLRKLKTGIPMPRWTEDKFNGAEHSSANDYMSAIAHQPINSTNLYSKHDSYIGNPTDDKLFELVRNLEQDTSMDHELKGKDTNIGNARSPYSPQSTSFIRKTSLSKMRSLLVAQHLFRKEILSQSGGWSDSQTLLFDGKYADINPMFHLGGDNIEPPHYGGPNADSAAIFKTFPEEAMAELPAEDREKKMVNGISMLLGHPWMTLGQLYNPTLYSFLSHNSIFHYWSALNFPHAVVSEPFYYAHRLLSQTWLYESKSSAYKNQLQAFENTPYKGLGGHPLLDGNLFFQRRISQFAPLNNKQAFEYNRMRGNLIRTILLLQKESLSKGIKPTNSAELLNRLERTDISFLPGFMAFANQMAAFENSSELKSSGISWATDASLYGSKLQILIRDVATQIRSN